MSSVIKSGSAGALKEVRPLVQLGASMPAVLSRQDEERERLRRRIETLEGEVCTREVALSELRAEMDVASKNAFARGVESGVVQAEDRQAARLAALEQTLGDAQSRLKESFASLERLAPLLARECLDKLFADGEQRTALVAAVLEKQIKTIEKETLVRIEVAAEDFADPALLAPLAERLGIAADAIVARGEMQTGHARIALRLGRLDIGPVQQWSVLRDLLAELSRPEASP